MAAMHAVLNHPLPTHGLHGFGCAGFATMPAPSLPHHLLISNASQLPTKALDRVRKSLRKDYPDLQTYIDEGSAWSATTQAVASACTTASVAVVVLSPDSIRSSGRMLQLQLLLQRWPSDVTLVPVLCGLTLEQLTFSRQLYDSPEAWLTATEPKPAPEVLDQWSTNLMLLSTCLAISADQSDSDLAHQIVQAAVAHLADTQRLPQPSRDQTTQTLPRPRSMPSGLSETPTMPRLPAVRLSTTRPTLARPAPTPFSPPTHAHTPPLAQPLASDASDALSDSGCESDDDYADDSSDLSSRRSQNTPRMTIFREQQAPPPPPVTLHDLGQQSNTRALQEQLVVMRAGTLGWGHPDTLTAMHDLAALLGAQRELAAARQLQDQVVAGRTALLGPEDAETLGAKNNLAWTLRELGDLEGAEELLGEVVAARTRQLGAGHPRTLTAKGNLARTRFAMGGEHVQEAAQLQEEIVRDLGVIKGAQHPNTLLAKRDLARTLQAMGSLRRARMLLESAVAGLLQHLAPQHREVIATRELLAEVSAAAQ